MPHAGRCGVISLAEADGRIAGLEAVRAEAAAGSSTWPGSEDSHFAVGATALSSLPRPLARKLANTAAAAMIPGRPDLRLWLRQDRRVDQGLERFSWPCCCRPKRTPTSIDSRYTSCSGGASLSAGHPGWPTWRWPSGRQRLADSGAGGVNICPWAAAALAGTPVPIDRAQTAAELGLKRLLRNTSTRSAIADLRRIQRPPPSLHPGCTSAAWLKR